MLQLKDCIDKINMYGTITELYKSPTNYRCKIKCSDDSEYDFNVTEKQYAKLKLSQKVRIIGHAELKIIDKYRDEIPYGFVLVADIINISIV